MNRTKYKQKSLELFQTNQFMKFNPDPTKSVEGKKVCILRKFKSRLS